ncbi:MAG: threonylcarbamoyl-AMP synthase [Myxococcales bacterium]|nr:MAG: threonylcarbamoyl-AMP synthase [Myxococcales bacterium]
MRIQIHPEHPEPHKIRQAVEALRHGGVIAYPTDSTYGLGCDAFQKKAIDQLYRIKQLAKDHPLTLLCPDLSQIAKYAVVDNQSYRLMRRLVPGPYVFVLSATKEVPKLLMRKRRTVGIRVPDHPVVHALLAEYGGPLVSTSASYQGDILRDPAEIAARFPAVAEILDVELGGMHPSTIVDLTSDVPAILREGAGDIEAVLGSIQ